MNALPSRDAEREEPAQLHLYAMDNLSYIRDTMARSTSFTAVPGWGMVGMGVIATVGAWVAAWEHSVLWWFNVWFFVAIVGCSFGVLCMFYKAERVGVPVVKGSGRKFLMHFCPAILAGGMITALLFELDLFYLMPGVWLLLYGVGIVSAGAFSVPVLPIMGLVFMLFGCATSLCTLFLGPVQFGIFLLEDLFLAAGFGGIHIIGGLIIARRYGG